MKLTPSDTLLVIAIAAWLLIGCALLAIWRRGAGHWERDVTQVYETFPMAGKWFVRGGPKIDGVVYFRENFLGPYNTEAEANTYRDINGHALNWTWVGRGKPGKGPREEAMP